MLFTHTITTVYNICAIFYSQPIINLMCDIITLICRAPDVTLSYCFIQEPPADLKCVVCLDVTRDPQQHSVCGNLICKECLEKLQGNACPACRTTEGEFFPDKWSKLMQMRGIKIGKQRTKLALQVVKQSRSCQ